MGLGRDSATGKESEGEGKGEDKAGLMSQVVLGVNRSVGSCSGSRTLCCVGAGLPIWEASSTATRREHDEERVQERGWGTETETKSDTHVHRTPGDHHYGLSPWHHSWGGPVLEPGEGDGRR